MMKLLTSHSLTVRNRFTPEKMALQLSERQSTATLTLGPDQPTINVGDWIQSDGGPADNTVWRVKTVDTQVDTNTRTVTLEHMIQALKDRILFGERKPEAIGGNGKPSAYQTVLYILGNQSDWVLGDFSFSTSQPYSFNGDDLYSALETVSGTLTDCFWEYNFDSYPFKLHMHQLDSTVVSEMRTDRNIRTLKRTIDRSRMYTRHYPIGKDDLHISGDYVSRNEDVYGVVCKTETDQSKTTEAELRSWANERLSRHCEPIVTVSVSGLDLSEATKEPLDRFRIGRMCRIPLPEYDNTMITERVTKLNYTDIVNEPMTVTITLANELADVASIVKQEQAATAKAGRVGAGQSKEDHAWFVDTDEKVGMVAEALAGPGADKDWSRVSSIFVDGEGIHQKVVYAEGEIVKHQTAIEANEKAIELMAESYDEQLGNLSGKISVSAGRIDQVVKAVGDGEKVTAASICLAITKAGSKAAITADHITLGTNKLSNILMVTGQGVGIQKGVVTPNVILQTGTTHFASLQNAIVKATVTGTVLTLENAKGEKVTFDKAAASPRLSGSWSNGKLTVTSTPSAQANFERLLAQGTVEWAEDYLSCTVPINAQFGQSGQYSESTGWSAYVNTSDAWWDGYNSAPSSSYTGRTMQCTGKSQTYPGSSTYYYTFRLEGNYSFSTGTNYTMYRTSW